MPSFKPDFYKLPETIQRMLKYAVEQIHPDQVILFGSRARGTHRENSDFDFAIKKQTIPEDVWSKTLVHLSEAPYTLFKTDIVRYDHMDKNYISNIKKDGVLIYG